MRQEYEGEAICKACGGESVYLGSLGRCCWFRCRDCGLDFTYDEEVDDED